MEPAVYILSGVVIALGSGVIGKGIGGKNKVKEKSCVERREACVGLVSVKIDNLTKVVEDLKNSVDNRSFNK